MQQPMTNASKPTSDHTWKTPHLKPNGNHPKRPHGPHRRAPQLQYGWIPTTAPHGNIRLRKLRIWIPLTPLCCNSQCDNITLLYTVHLQLIRQIKCPVLSCPCPVLSNQSTNQPTNLQIYLACASLQPTNQNLLVLLQHTYLPTSQSINQPTNQKQTVVSTAIFEQQTAGAQLRILTHWL